MLFIIIRPYLYGLIIPHILLLVKSFVIFWDVRFIIKGYKLLDKAVL